MKKKITIIDIAQLANVSKSTVSRYFNGGYVKDSTKAKIEQVINEQHFVVNPFARLKAKKSNIIGIIAPCLDSISTSRVLMGIDSYLQSKGISTFITNTNHDISLELKNMVSLNSMNVDGIILSATILTSEHLELINTLTVPVVIVGQQYQHSVIYNNYQASQFLANKIVNAGYKKVLLIGIEQKDYAIGVERTNGLLEVFEQHNIEVKHLISDFSYAKAEVVVKHALFEYDADIIICLTTQQLLASYNVLKALNYQIPNDVGLCGFGGYEYIEYMNPKLTTIQYDYYLTGEKAASMMLDLIDEKTVGVEVIDYEYHQGESIKE